MVGRPASCSAPDELTNLAGVLDPDGYSGPEPRWPASGWSCTAPGRCCARRTAATSASSARGPWVVPDRLLADGERIELSTRVLEAKLTPGIRAGT